MHGKVPIKMKTFFSYLNSIRAVSLCIWKQSQLPTKQPQQYIDGSKMKYVYNLIFLQPPGCLKSNYSKKKKKVITHILPAFISMS